MKEQSHSTSVLRHGVHLAQGTSRQAEHGGIGPLMGLLNPLQDQRMQREGTLQVG